jgi:hypothetical protein
VSTLRDVLHAFAASHRWALLLPPPPPPLLLLLLLLLLQVVP